MFCVHQAAEHENVNKRRRHDASQTAEKYNAAAYTTTTSMKCTVCPTCGKGDFIHTNAGKLGNEAKAESVWGNTSAHVVVLEVLGLLGLSDVASSSKASYVSKDFLGCVADLVNDHVLSTVLNCKDEAGGFVHSEQAKRSELTGGARRRCYRTALHLTILKLLQLKKDQKKSGVGRQDASFNLHILTGCSGGEGRPRPPPDFTYHEASWPFVNTLNI